MLEEATSLSYCKKSRHVATAENQRLYRKVTYNIKSNGDIIPSTYMHTACLDCEYERRYGMPRSRPNYRRLKCAGVV
jgi:hypothetical protein